MSKSKLIVRRKISGRKERYIVVVTDVGVNSLVRYL